MGRVISGKYHGGKIKTSGNYLCLYIKQRGKIVPLDSLRVASYELKEIETNPFTFFDRVYTVTWKDGSKSVIGIEKTSMTTFISGCETAELSDDNITHMLHGKKIAAIVSASILTAIGCYAIISTSSINRETTPASATSDETDAGIKVEAEASQPDQVERDHSTNTSSAVQSNDSTTPRAGDGVKTVGEPSQDQDVNTAQDNTNIVTPIPDQDEPETPPVICTYHDKYGDATPEELAGSNSHVLKLKGILENKKAIAHGFDPQYAHDHREEYANAWSESNQAFSDYSEALSAKRYEYELELAKCSNE